MRDVNFPENLDITPLLHRQGQPTCSQTFNHTAFGHAAQRDAIERYGIAGRVWEAAYALHQYIQPPPDLAFDPAFTPISASRSPMTILELGSGTGIIMSCIANALHPSDHILIATDLPEVCSLLEQNLRAFSMPKESHNSAKNTIFIRPLAWGNESHCLTMASEFFLRSRTLSHIICSDLIYFPELFAPLLRTLIQLTAPPFSRPPTPDDPGVAVILSYKIRSFSKETPFWSTFGLWFDFEPVLVMNTAFKGGWLQYGTSSDDVPFIFIAHRRPDSLYWTAPANDKDLLSGKGAMGNDSAKSDDTFETLLFMGLEISDI